jgi:hypothetical protein
LLRSSASLLRPTYFLHISVQAIVVIPNAVRTIDRKTFGSNMLSDRKGVGRALGERESCRV